MFNDYFPEKYEKLDKSIESDGIRNLQELTEIMVFQSFWLKYVKIRENNEKS